MNKPMRVIDRQIQLHQEGRVRLGEIVAGTTREGKAYTRPAMLETFRLTTASRAMLECAAKIFGGTVKPWEGHPGQFELYTERRELKVAVSAQNSISSAYERWSGGGCTHRCDGQTCHRITVTGTGREQKAIAEDLPCICDPIEREAGTNKNLCQFTTRLSFMLTELPALGLWRLDTKGKIAGSELPAIIDMMAQLGFDSGPIYCILTAQQQEAKKPGQPTSKFVVPVLTLDPEPASLASLIQSVQAASLTAPTALQSLPGASKALPTAKASKMALLDAHGVTGEQCVPMAKRVKALGGTFEAFLDGALRDDQIGLDALTKRIEALEADKAAQAATGAQDAEFKEDEPASIEIQFGLDSDQAQELQAKCKSRGIDYLAFMEEAKAEGAKGFTDLLRKVAAQNGNPQGTLAE